MRWVHDESSTWRHNDASADLWRHPFRLTEVRWGEDRTVSHDWRPSPLWPWGDSRPRNRLIAWGRRESTNHVSQDYIRCQSSRPLFCWRMSLSFPSDPFIRLRQPVLPGVVKINSLSTVQYCSELGLWKSVCNTVVKYESLCVLESWRINLSIFKSEQRFLEGEDSNYMFSGEEHLNLVETWQFSCVSL